MLGFAYIYVWWTEFRKINDVQDLFSTLIMTIVMSMDPDPHSDFQLDSYQQEMNGLQHCINQHGLEQLMIADGIGRL